MEVTPGNIHDSVAFEPLYDQICQQYPEHKIIVADSAYKTPWICKRIFDSGRILSTAYKRPMTKKNGLPWRDYVYDEYYDCVICPEYKILHYATTTRDGYRQYKSKGYQCQVCPSLQQCTENQKCEKTVNRHIWQDYLEKAFNVDTNSTIFPAVINEEYPEGAFVVLGLDGQIKAIAGSDRTKTGARTFNRARDAVRHPGSTIKPIASYSLAVENDIIHFSSLVEDSPITITENGVQRTWPVNFYGSYLGNITVNIAIQRSTNTIPVKLQQIITPQVSFNFLKNKLGISTLVESRTENGRVLSDINLAPMALGEMTDGVTPLAMAGAYQIFGNGGIYTEPYSYTRVETADGTVILEHTPISNRVISSESATVLNHLLQGVTTGTYGTGTTAKFSAMPVAGKTGTSDNDNNQWFIGVTPYYVGVCWLGYDIPEQIRYYSYAPPIIYKNIMGPIHQNLAVVQFQDDPDVEVLEYCTITGDLAGDDCETTATGWYKPSNIPPVCDGDHDVNKKDEDEEDQDQDEDEKKDEDEEDDRRSSRDDEDEE